MLDQDTITKYARFDSFVSDPRFMDIICSHVIEGGTLTAYCKMNKLAFSQIIKFINSDKDRRKQYQEALSFRREHMAEEVLEEFKHLTTFNLADMYYRDENDHDEYGKPRLKVKELVDMPESLQKAIKAIDFKNNKITFVDRLQALMAKAKATDLLTVTISDATVKSLEDMIGESFKQLPQGKQDGPVDSSEGQNK